MDIFKKPIPAVACPCGKLITFKENGKPDADYYKADFSIVFCSAQCSLDHHENERKSKDTNIT